MSQNEEVVDFLELTPVQHFYADSTIFLTGGTGFIGKLVLEKLLRSCRHLKKIYVLVRTKKNKNAEDRLQELLQNEVFSNMHIYNEDFKKQVHLVEGNIEMPNLGLSESDTKRITEEVELVFHVAASVRFDMTLKKMAYANIQATREMIMLAHKIKKLKMFTYVSSAYSFCHENTVEEKIYDVPMSAAKFMNLVENTSEDDLEKQASKIIGKWKNGYVFTKAISEQAVLTEGEGLPRVIARPTIVTSANNEPFPGWVDTFFGPVGATVLACLGVVHVFLADKNALVDYVPADYVVNHILAITYDCYTNRNNNMKTIEGTNKELSEVPIYICSSSVQNPITYGNQIYWTDKIGRIVGSKTQYCHAWNITTKNPKTFVILHNIIHVIPGYIADCVMKCMGKEARFVRDLEKMKKTFLAVSQFTMNSMIFKDNNTQQMMERMSTIDKAVFYCDVTKICWHTYLYNVLIGGKKFLLKESIDSIQDFDEGVKHTALLEKIHYGILLFLVYLLYLFVSFVCKL